jgi:hypothetical protein
MAKKELNFGKLGLPAKANIIKKEDATTPNIEKAIEKIHGETPKLVPEIKVVAEPVVVPVIVETAAQPTVSAALKGNKSNATKATLVELDEMMPVKKISMDLPLDIYKYLKINSFDQAVTMKDYVLRLIEADMKKKKI